MKTQTANHTPGPWKRTDRNGAYTIEGSNGQVVLLIADDRRLIPMRSDSALILAAPELIAQRDALLEAVQSFVDSARFNSHWENGNAICNIDTGTPASYDTAKLKQAFHQARATIALCEPKEREMV